MYSKSHFLFSISVIVMSILSRALLTGFIILRLKIASTTLCNLMSCTDNCSAEHQVNMVEVSNAVARLPVAYILLLFDHPFEIT